MVALAELYITKVGHPPYLSQPSQDIVGDAIVDGQDHHRAASRGITADLHAGDVHVVLAEDGAHAADDAGPVLVPADQEAAFGHQVHTKRVDADRARLTHQQGARDL